MLERLCEQQSAVVEHQLQNACRSSGQHTHITADEWACISDICEVLRKFEESTKMVSGDDDIISVSMPLLCLLKRSLITIKEEALRVDWVETEEGSTAVHSQTSLMSSSQRGLVDHNEDEEEEEQQVWLPALQQVVPTTATSGPFSVDGLTRRRRRGRIKRR
ncbi:hypothetical protein PRIEUP_LOCUS939 [Pristimantis euphronides]